MTIIEEVIEEEETNEKEENCEEYVEHANEGGVLVIRRSLHANQGDEGP